MDLQSLEETQINIQGLVNGIKKTSLYAAIAEVISNSVYSIHKAKQAKGEITIQIERNEEQITLNMDNNNALADVKAFTITDNGLGFTEENLLSCKTAFSDYKKETGGKGFGRFLFLKCFRQVSIKSVYKDQNDSYKKINFDLGRGASLIDSPKQENAQTTKTYASIRLEAPVSSFTDKKIETIARKILERILLNFTGSKKYIPRIVIQDPDNNSKEIVLNELIKADKEIQPIAQGGFKMKGHDQEEYQFSYNIYKIWFPEKQKSSIILASSYMEVTKNPIKEYISEFADDFAGNFTNKQGETSNNYIIKIYITGQYLDNHVSMERTGFDFSERGGIDYPLGKKDIEEEAAQYAKNNFEGELEERRAIKKQLVRKTVDEKLPYLARYIDDIDYSSIGIKAGAEEIEFALEKTRIKYRQKMEKITASKNIDEITEKIMTAILNQNKDNLVRYVIERRVIIDLLDKNLGLNAEGEYSREKDLHDLIFQSKKDSDSIPIESQNLWLVDERLNFVKFVTSDKPIGGKDRDRPDVAMFHNNIAFRVSGDSGSPITLFEFKRPGDTKFSSNPTKDDPIEQIIRYANTLLDKGEDYKGKQINTIRGTTPVYGYVIMDLDSETKNWLENTKDFTKMADGMGYFKWHQKNSMYIEVISWQKLLNDARLRNKIFMDKLGL